MVMYCISIWWECWVNLMQCSLVPGWTAPVCVLVSAAGPLWFLHRETQFSDDWNQCPTLQLSAINTLSDSPDVTDLFSKNCGSIWKQRFNCYLTTVERLRSDNYWTASKYNVTLSNFWLHNKKWFSHTYQWWLKGQGGHVCGWPQHGSHPAR